MCTDANGSTCADNRGIMCMDACRITCTDFPTESTGMQGSTCMDVSTGNTDICGITCTYNKFNMHEPKQACIEPGMDHVRMDGVRKI